MRKNLLLTTLLSLFAMMGFAQETTSWPITLTTADGLPGTKVVRNYMYQSEVFNLEEATNVLRFTVISTNTVDALTSRSYDGLSADWGPGFPFFTMSEFRIYDGDGTQIEYSADANSLAVGDGGGIEALNDKNEGTYLHTTYSGGTLPNAYHYLEFTLSKSVKSFSFNWNTRSDYHKNLITHMGITPGTLYLPYPEQQFQLGEQVTDVADLAEAGGLFVIRSNGDDFLLKPEDENYNRIHKGKTFMHAPYGGNETPNAAALVCLIPDNKVENGYKVHWLNNGHYIIKQELMGGSQWTHWTNEELDAATIQFAPCDTAAGAFVLTVNEGKYFLAYDALGNMIYTANDPDNDNIFNGVGPRTFHYNIYKASINGAAIAAQLQEGIDEAQARLDAVGLHPEDEGEYDALVAIIAKAKGLMENPEATAAEVIAAKNELNRLTAAYAAVTIWAYVDSIESISAAVDAGDVVITSAPEWVAGGYSDDAYLALLAQSDAAQIVIDSYQSLAEIDLAIANIFAAIDRFWSAKITHVMTLPFRVGSEADGLPGEMQGYGGYRWESPVYYLSNETEALRFTVFRTNTGHSYNGIYPYVTMGEMEFYDAGGNKINYSADDVYMNSVYPDDGGGVSSLCDGNYNSHCHGAWGSGQNYDYDENPAYQYIEITFPEPVSTFKYIQYGRDNAGSTPIDFVIGAGGIDYTPEDVKLADPNNIQILSQVTSVDQITDDGFYALVGLLNCAPESESEVKGTEKFYAGNVSFGKELTADAFFSIRKTGDEDGTFYIQSFKDACYWSNNVSENAWHDATVSSRLSEAAKMHIIPTPRAEFGLQEFPNTFMIYHINDSVKREGADGEPVPHPYIITQDWGNNSGYFSVDSLQNTDWDGESEWKIFKVTMDNPNIYWLNVLYSIASSKNMQVSADPGYYSIESAGAYAEALAKAQKALEANDDAVAKAAVPGLIATIELTETAETNPMVAGIYVLETADDRFFNNQGVSKVMCTYFNDFEEDSYMCTSEYSLWWADAPADYMNAHDRYKFEFIPAKDSEKLLIWLDDGMITEEDMANAYYIKSVETGQYVASADGEIGKDIGLTDEPEEPYIVRPQGAYRFDFWHPSHEGASLHMQDHNQGSGAGGDIVYWYASEIWSLWHMRLIEKTTTGISDVVTEGDEVVSVTYYTAGGAAVAAPVKGINIVKTVYANGVVKSEKVFIK